MSVEVVERDGAFVVNSSCRDCERPVSLPCGAEDPRVGVGGELALKFAALIVCDHCSMLAEDERSRVERDRAMSERAQNAGVPARFRNLSFDEMVRSGKRAAAIDAAKQWAEAGRFQARGLLLWGSYGTGKSRLAATACWHRLSRHPVRWCSVSLLIASLQAAFADDERRQALRVLTGKDALVLDDLDKVPVSEQVRSQLFVAVDRRINEGAPLLVTTNVAPGGLRDKFGEAIASRLLSYCGLWVFEMDGPDRRLELRGEL